MDTLEVDPGVLQVQLACIKEEVDDDGESMSSLTAAEGGLSHEVHSLTNTDGLVGDDNDTLPSAISNSSEDDDPGVSVDPSAEGSVVSVMDDGSVSNSSALEAVAAIGNAIPVTSEQVIGLLHVLQAGEGDCVGEVGHGHQVSIAMTLPEGTLLSSGHTIQAITMPDGSTAYLHPPKDGSFLAGQGLTLVDGRTAIVQGLGSDKEGSNDSTKLFDGQSIQFEDGTTALLQAGKSALGESFRAITLDDGTTAYITNSNNADSLFGDAASLDGSTLSLDQLTSGTVLNGSLSRLTGEKQLSLGDKAFKCAYESCGRLYTTLHHLKVHERAHTGDRPFKCDFLDCNKAFATGYGLKSHTRVHTGEKPYPCPEDNCDKAFKTSGDLQKHVRTHTGERPFQCPFEGCDRSFTTSNIRKVHIRTHTGERPYVCQLQGCNRAFASATNYKNHIRIHTGEKPYVCTVAGCGKRFTEYSSLYKHHVVHTHSKPYVCNICSKTYRQTSTLAMHKRTSHGVEVTNDLEVHFAEQHEGESSQERPGKRRKVEFTMSSADANSNLEDGDGTLVINTSDVQQMNQVAAAMVSAEGESQGLQMLTLPPATLQQLSQGGGITSITVGDQGQQVLVVTDPSHLEAIQRQLAQHQSFEDSGLEQAVEGADSDAVNAITIATGDSGVTDATMVMFQTE